MEDNELPGDYTDGETPEPIPNSEAKPVKPMVVREGESRYRQDFIRAVVCVCITALAFWVDREMGGRVRLKPDCQEL